MLVAALVTCMIAEGAATQRHAWRLLLVLTELDHVCEAIRT